MGQSALPNRDKSAPESAYGYPYGPPAIPADVAYSDAPALRGFVVTNKGAVHGKRWQPVQPA